MSFLTENIKLNQQFSITTTIASTITVPMYIMMMCLITSANVKRTYTEYTVAFTVHNIVRHYYVL